MGCCKSKEAGEEITRKIAVVGDAGVGKTCFIQRYIKNEYDEDTPSVSIPSALQVDEKVQTLKNGQKVHLFIYDLGGKDTFRHLTKLNYPRSDAALICFSVDKESSPGSLEAVQNYWAPEMHRICPGIPIILVGLKKDLRDEARTTDNFVREIQGNNVAKKRNLCAYMECSSATGYGVKAVFEKIASEAARRQTTRT